MKHKILFVDDEPANLRMLERLFRDDHEVITATSGVEALEILNHYDIELIVTDQRMPGMTGIEFLKRAAIERPQTVRIVLTGYTDVSDLVEAVNCGVVYRYITKPWVNADLRQTVLSAGEHYEANKDHHLLIQENERLECRLRDTVHGFVETVVEIMGHKNNHLAEHCRRTAKYAALIGEKLGLDDEDMKQLGLAAALHEVPNSWLPFEMGLDKSSLTSDQYRITRSRFETGLGLISSIPDLREVTSILKYQHEHFDGTGFFDGLEGEKIPLMSRILAIANAYDDHNTRMAATSVRSAERPSDWLRNHARFEFDPRIVEACLSSNFVQPANPINDIKPAAIRPPFAAPESIRV